MDVTMRTELRATTSLQHDPNYIALSRMLARYQNLILLTPTPDPRLDARLAQWQKKVQAELWSPLPFHRMKWLRSIEGARTHLLKLEQSAQSIKVQRTKRETVKDLAEKRMIIKRLRSRVEEIGREVDSGSDNYSTPYSVDDDEETETMYDVLQQIRRSKNQATLDANVGLAGTSEQEPKAPDQDSTRDALFESSPNIRRRQGKPADDEYQPQSKTSGFSNLGETENSLLAASREHEDITTSLLSMAAQLKQQARQFQFTLEQDKGFIDRAMEGLDKNVDAMGIASKGLRTLERMSEEQGWLGRLKLQAFIFVMWMFAILLVFAGPKLRF